MSFTGMPASVSLNISFNLAFLYKMVRGTPYLATDWGNDGILTIMDLEYD